MRQFCSGALGLSVILFLLRLDDVECWNKNVTKEVVKGVEVYPVALNDGHGHIKKTDAGALTWYAITDYPFITNKSVPDPVIRNFHNRNLNVITNAALLVSYVGQGLIFTTAICLPNWRYITANRISVQLCIAFALHAADFFLAESISLDIGPPHCTLLRAGFQYLTILIFFWLLTLAVHAYVKVVLVFKKKEISKFFLKSMFVNWLSPLLPVILCVTLSPEYFKDEMTGNCVSTKVAAFHLIVRIPVLIILILNLCLYIRIIYAIRKKSSVRSTLKTSDIRQVITSSFFFFFLGLTWSFEMMTMLPMPENVVIVCYYIFCLTSPIHGIVLFIFLIVLNKQTRKMWVDFIRGRPRAYRSYSISQINQSVHAV